MRTRREREKQRQKRREAAARRIAQIKERVQGFDHVCSGTLSQRTKRCGKPTCRCAKDPAARHGPYYEWGRMKQGKLVSRLVPPEQVALLRDAIANYRTIRKLLRAWEAETVTILEAQDEPN